MGQVRGEEPALSGGVNGWGGATGWPDTDVADGAGLRSQDRLFELRISMPLPSELLSCLQRIKPLLAAMKTWERWGVYEAVLSLCVACHNEPNDSPAQVEWMYYPSGQLRRTAVVQHGQLHGPIVWYYRNGAWQKTSYYVRGQAVGSKVLFDLTGKPLERHVYDMKGRIFFYTGVQRMGAPFEHNPAATHQHTGYRFLWPCVRGLNSI